MASLTRTVYGPDGRGLQTITGSDGSVTQRVLEAQSRRVEAQVTSNAQEPLVTWDGDGRIKPVGANDSYRPRGVQANTGLGKGDPVQLNGGLVSATPSNGGNSTELQSQIKAQAETLVKIAKNLPGQIGEGDPNTETTPGTKDVLPRYPDDTYYDESSGTLFVWDSDQESDPADPRWVPRHQLFQGFTGDPNNQGGSAIPVYLDGAIAATSSGTIYTGDSATGDWTLASGTEIEDMDLITDAGDGSYQIITSSSHRYTVEGIDTAGTGTVTLSPTIGQDVQVDGSLTATLSGNDDSRYSFTVHLRRHG